MTTSIALRIDVLSERGFRFGILPMLAQLQQYHCRATFFLSFLRPPAVCQQHPWWQQIKATDTLRSYPMAEWLRARFSRHYSAADADIFQSIIAAGCEVGISLFTPNEWRQPASAAEMLLVEQAIESTVQQFRVFFPQAPLRFAAPNWQMSRHALRCLSRYPVSFVSMTRGRAPYVPLWHAELLPYLEIPTTLPTLDELPQQTAVETLSQLAAKPTDFMLFRGTADREGISARSQFGELLSAWQSANHTVKSLQAVADVTSLMPVQGCALNFGEINGRQQPLLLQGDQLFDGGTLLQSRPFSTASVSMPTSLTFSNAN